MTSRSPAGALLPAGGYLVVARDAVRLRARYPQLNAVNTYGDYSGNLSDAGERVALSRPDDPLLPAEDLVVVNELTYGDSINWGYWADGGGSSLELVDARADNRWAMNWAGSDETGKAGWTEVEYTGTIDNGTGIPDQLRLMALQAGEFLIDDIVVEQPGGTVYLNSNFESGLSPWSIYGNHSRSALETGEGYGSAQSLHVRASGPGNEGVWGGWPEAFWNHAEAPLSGTLTLDSTNTIRARVRWLAGWPHLTLAVRGFYMAADVRMDIPDTLGTPGLVNSRAAARFKQSRYRWNLRKKKMDIPDDDFSTVFSVVDAAAQPDDAVFTAPPTRSWRSAASMTTKGLRQA